MTLLIPKQVWSFDEKSEWDEEWKSTSELSEANPSNMSLIKAYQIL